MKRATLLVLGCILCSGCISTLTYAPDYPLDQTVFASRDGQLRGYVPVGWFSSTQDSIAPALQAWLLREDCEAEITIRRLQLDEVTAARVNDQGISFIARATMPLYDSTGQRKGSEPETYHLGVYECAAFEAGSGTGRTRIVIFARDSAFYECVARHLSAAAADGDINMLFRTQQSVLQSFSLVR